MEAPTTQPCRRTSAGVSLNPCFASGVLVSCFDSVWHSTDTIHGELDTQIQHAAVKPYTSTFLESPSPSKFPLSSGPKAIWEFPKIGDPNIVPEVVGSRL